MKKKYNVLVPKYHDAGVDHWGNKQYNVSWKTVGQADTLEEAKKIIKYPVLSENF